jgi:hypothetical protein
VARRALLDTCFDPEMETICSSETSVDLNELYGVISRKILLFTLNTAASYANHFLERNVTLRT